MMHTGTHNSVLNSQRYTEFSSSQIRPIWVEEAGKSYTNFLRLT